LNRRLEAKVKLVDFSRGERYNYSYLTKLCSNFERRNKRKVEVLSLTGDEDTSARFDKGTIGFDGKCSLKSASKV